MNHINAWSAKQKAIFILIIFYTPFHLWLTPGYWDDAVFARVLTQYQYNLAQYTLDRYMTWSSRISIELVLPFMAALPGIIWKIANIFMILLLFCDLRWTLIKVFGIEPQKMDIILALLLCAYPFSTMAQTGWIATTMNYLWVVALGWYVINRMLDTAVWEHTPSRCEMILSCMAAFYSVGYESMAAIIFMVGIGIIVYSFVKGRRVSGLVWLCFGITILMLLYIFLCPGNRLRPIKDAQLWMPDYFNLNFFDKIRVGILSTFMHFVSIPSPIFFVMNLAVFVLGKRKGRKSWLVGAIPIILDAAWTCYFLINYLLGYRSFTYQVPEAVMSGMKDTAEQVLMLISVAAWFIAVLYIIFRSMPVQKAICFTIVLETACIPEMVVGITPTVYASILRTTIYLYMAMIVMIIVIFQEIKWDSYKKMSVFFYFCLGCGMLLNACQMARHIMIYG